MVYNGCSNVRPDERTPARGTGGDHARRRCVGKGARDVEPAYPLMKVLNRITGKDSPYAQTIHSVVHELYNGVE